MNLPDNVILIGMPGVGKSTLGVLLAKEMGYRFVDSDLVLQQREGRLLSQIIAQEGNDRFLAIEEEINLSMDGRHTVIATGGSAVYSARAMEHLARMGTVIYLRLSCQRLKSRLRNIRRRGVVLPPGYTLEQLYEERRVLYERYADIVIDAEWGGIEKTLSKLSAALGLPRRTGV